MSPNVLAEFIFWMCLSAMLFALYQAAVLPGLRLRLRYRVFELRDRLRALVISGAVDESDPAFNLLHDQLNFVSCNLFRYDLLRIAQSASRMTNEQKAYVEKRVKIIEEAHEDIQKIYRESLDAVAQAVVLNSLLFFLAISVCFGVFLLFQVGVRHVREAYRRRIERDTRAALIFPEFAAVAV